MLFRNIKFIVLSGLVFTFLWSCNDDKTSTSTSVATEEVKKAEFPYEGKIAFVNIDSLEEHYIFLQEKKTQLENKQKAVENELNNLNRQFQRKMEQFQQKYVDGTLTADEAEKTEKELMNMQERFEKRQYDAQNELLKMQADLMQELQTKLNDYIKEYNADKKFAYILSYGEGGSILYADPQYEVTDDVIAGMNAALEKKEDKKEEKPANE